MAKRRNGNGNGKRNGKNVGGRPSTYDNKHTTEEMAYNLALLGATDEQLAEAFDVSIGTIYNWKENNEGFLKAIKAGKTIADANVAKSLYHRACGYSHPEDKVFLYKGEPVTVRVTKHYPPETPAICFWLRNRQGWRDVQYIKGEVNHRHRHVSIDLTDLTREELEMAQQLGLSIKERKRIGNGTGSDNQV